MNGKKGKIMKQISADQVASQFDWDISEIREFVGEVLEDANDHWLAHAIWSFDRGDLDLACDFLKLEYEIESQRELTPALRDRSKSLLDQFAKLQEEEDEGN